MSFRNAETPSVTHTLARTARRGEVIVVVVAATVTVIMYEIICNLFLNGEHNNKNEYSQYSHAPFGRPTKVYEYLFYGSACDQVFVKMSV